MIKNRLLTRRRNFLLGLGAAVGAGAFTMSSRSRQLNNQEQAIGDEERDFSVIGDAPLRDRAAAKGLIYGAATGFHMLSSNPKFAARFAQECAILVPENELKWGSLRPSPNRFDFTQGDAMAEFASAHNMLFRGHTLVWHLGLPRWFKHKVNRQNAEQILIDHIKTVAGHYAGKMHSWDVVNEAIELSAQRYDGLRKTPWLAFLGPDYIDIAFRTAAEADPQALLAYNDFGLDYDTRKDEAKRTAVLKLLERLKSIGTPVHALGIQAHLWGGESPFNPKKLTTFLHDVASLGLKIMITEIDVADKTLPLNAGIRDRIVAGVYEDYLSIMLDEPAVIAVLTWGLSDHYTWLSSYESREDSAPVRPLPLDAQLSRKLAWNAIARAFDRGPMREVEHKAKRNLI